MTLHGALEVHHHNRGDQKLGLQEKLIDATVHFTHGHHFQEVSKGIPQADDDEDGRARGNGPTCLHTFHAFLLKSQEIHEKHGENLAHDCWTVLGVQHLPIDLGIVNDHGMQGSAENEDDENGRTAARHGATSKNSGEGGEVTSFQSRNCGRGNKAAPLEQSSNLFNCFSILKLQNRIKHVRNNKQIQAVA